MQPNQWLQNKGKMPHQDSKGRYSITIERFRIDALIAAAARCGGYNLGFEAEVRVETNSLDADGFTIENEGLVEKLRDRFRFGENRKGGCETDVQVVWKASCEQLTEGIAHVITELIPSDRLTGISVRVFNHIGHTELRWNAGEEIPKFPRLATPAEVKETQRQNRERGVQSKC